MFTWPINPYIKIHSEELSHNLDTFTAENLQRHNLDTFTAENLQRLLQGRDLGLALSNTFSIAHHLFDAGWLKLLVVRHGGIQLFLRNPEVFLGSRQIRFRPLQTGSLVLGVCLLDRLILSRVCREGVILFLRCEFSFAGLSLQALKVGDDDFHHANDATASISSASERLVKRLWVGSFLIEFLEYGQCALNSYLCTVCILNCLCVLRLLVKTIGLGFRNSSINGLNLLRKVNNLRGKLLRIRCELLNSCLELGDSRGFHITGLLVGAHFSITECLVISFLISFLHKLLHHIVDHLSHLDKRI